MVWRFRISKRDHPFRSARLRVSKFSFPKGPSWSAGSRRCKNDHATCCRTIRTRTHCSHRPLCQLYLVIRFARFRSEAPNPFSRERFSLFSQTWSSLSLGSACVLPPVLEKLSPPAFSWELVSGLVLEWSFLLMQEWGWASRVSLLPLVLELLLAIRFRSSRLLQLASLLGFLPVPVDWIRAELMAALVMTIPVFPFRLSRDHQRHLTTQCFPDSMMPSPPHSSESVRR